MFPSSLAQRASDVANEAKTLVMAHMQVCERNQIRIEARFTDVVAKLDRQDTVLDAFKEEQSRRLDAIKESDNRRYVAMMTLIGTTCVGIGVQIIFHFWK